MSRLPYLDPDSNPQVAELFQEIAGTRGTMSNILHSLAHSPEGLRRLAHLGAWGRYGTVLGSRLRELAICAVARQLPYVWGHHVPLALQAGVAQEAIDEIEQGRIPGQLDEKEQAVVAYVLELPLEASVGDATFARLQAHFSAHEITDLSILVAYYLGVGTLAKAWKVELDSEEMKKRALDWQRGMDGRK